MSETQRNAVAVIGTTSTQVVAPTNGERKLLYFRNDSTAAQIITLTYGQQTAVVNEGFVLSPTQPVSESTGEGFVCWQGQVQAIASAAGAILSIVER